MKKLVLLVNSALGAALITILSVGVTLLYLMFSTSEDDAYREGLFGSVSFQTSTTSDGTTNATAGIENPVALLVPFVIAFVVVTFMQLTYRVLKAYRAELLARQRA